MLSSKASSKLVHRMILKSVNDIKRVKNTCESLAKTVQKPFQSVLNPIDEMIEVIQFTQGRYEMAQANSQTDLLETLRATIQLLSTVRKECLDLFIYFLSFNQGLASHFGGKLQRLIRMVTSFNEADVSITDRKVVLYIFSDDDRDLYSASYLLNILCHVCRPYSLYQLVKIVAVEK